MGGKNKNNTPLDGVNGVTIQHLDGDRLEVDVAALSKDENRIMGLAVQPDQSIETVFVNESKIARISARWYHTPPIEEDLIIFTTTKLPKKQQESVIDEFMMFDSPNYLKEESSLEEGLIKEWEAKESDYSPQLKSRES